MVETSYLHGAVYVFVNSKAQRVKVGLTTNTHNISSRLNDVNDIWLERKVKCQICGTRSIRFGFLVPPHVVSGTSCLGGNALPLEYDVSLAESHLQQLKRLAHGLSGTQKGSATRKINTLERRVELYRNYQPKVGHWQFSSAFITKHVEQVESLSHELLAEYIDTKAPIGEIFCCSISVATEAVEEALRNLGLLNSAIKKTEM